MAFVNIQAVIKKFDANKKGVQQIVLEVYGDELAEQCQQLFKMVGREVQVELDSQIVDYKVEINVQTNEPTVQYRVDETGIVHEMKEVVAEQQELDLGVPEKKAKTKQEEKTVPLNEIDEFIKAGLAPQYDDKLANVHEWAARRAEGESYLTISKDLSMSSGKVAELIDEYRARIAPLAEAWMKWKEQQELKEDFEDDVPAATDEQEEGDQEEQDEPEATEEPTEEPTGDAFDQEGDGDEFDFDVA